MVLIQALTDTKLAWRTNAILRAMAGDALLREQFATDPLQIFSDYVSADRISVSKVEAANQLVFAVFSSPQMRRWLADYSLRLGGRTPSRPLFAKQFANAAAASRDSLVALALVRSAAAGEGHFELQADFFRALLAAMAMGRAGSAALGTEMCPGATATEMSPGATGTEMSPGALSLAGSVASEITSASRFAGELRRLIASNGTEQSPGGGTEQSLGGTEMSPGALRLAQSLVAAIRRAERFSEMLLRAEGGTEMSPGTATEMSPGVTATELSPGASRLPLQLLAEMRIAARLALPLLAAEGTEMSPGGGTEQSPGGGTEMSPGRFGSFEALSSVLRRAELFSLEILRSAQGTEMSPGTATDMSPGITATEMSPGLAQIGIAERLQAELASAARFSAEILRAQVGTEMSPGSGTEQSPGGGTEMSPGALRLTEGLLRAVLGAQRLGRLLVQSAEGTEMSPGVTATEMSPGATATEMSPGSRLSERLVAEIDVAVRYANSLPKSASGGTEMSPGGGTEMSPGGGTEQSPGAAFNLVQLLAASVRRSQLFVNEIVRVAGGTEMSPGGTEVSPGGTEVSPGSGYGGLWDVALSAQVTVALGALVQYASALRHQGALDASGLEPG